MKKSGIVSSALFSVMLIGTATFGYAQKDDQHGNQNKPENRAPAQGGQRVEHQQGTQVNGQQGREQRQPEQKQQPVRIDRTQAKPAQVSPVRNEPGQQQSRPQQQRASNFDKQPQTWAQRGGYKGYRVPDDQFSRSFGSGHSFRMSGLPYREVSGHPRFEYGGFWLSMMDPYPDYWGADWNRSDDMYVDFNGGGYYLYDRRFPGRPGVALSISF